MLVPQNTAIVAVPRAAAVVPCARSGALAPYRRPVAYSQGGSIRNDIAASPCSCCQDGGAADAGALGLVVRRGAAQDAEGGARGERHDRQLRVDAQRAGDDRAVGDEQAVGEL